MQISDALGSKHNQRNHKRCWMSDFVTKKLEIYLFIPFETMVIIAHYSFFTHMNGKKLKFKNPFDPILNFGLVKNF